MKLMTTICISYQVWGVSNLDVKHWRSHTVYESYTPSYLCIDWFWQCVGDITEEEKLELFNFWTGTRWLPTDGFRELDHVLIIQMVHQLQKKSYISVVPRHTRVSTRSYSLLTSPLR
ncbi:hypothetical protein POM88_008323 [Heracleum sosnowskyi]|uniref:HECT-type E3 ubiquitin transferase n=1 Tax=Heracleum sosnowskyi TaxID=360622 RepID=A0AAD8N1M1_9APIA|nr:hypothetical protein POM88_008323 [Heracleum sosnowskyi]